MAAHYIHLIEGTALFGGSIVTDIDLANSTGTSKYNLVEPDGYQMGEPQFKPQESDSPTVDSIRLVDYTLKPRVDKALVDISGSSLDNLLLNKSALDQFFTKAMNAQ